jgi:cytochrome P450
MAARRRADEIVYAEIAHRRAHPDDGDDVLAALLAAQDDEGGPALSDEELRDQVVSLIAAGYETTSAGVAWTVHGMLSHPHTWARVREEMARVVGDDALTAEHLLAMPYLDAVVNESLRLWPPGPVSGRKAIDDFEYAGTTIPGGRLVLYSQFVTHRDPSLWPDPLAFRPERWDPSTPGYREPKPYSFLPFGGGYRRCIGFALATMEIKVLVAELVRRVELAGLRDDIEPFGISTMMPKGGVPVRVTARTSVEVA